jgi:hypothetical protein
MKKKWLYIGLGVLVVGYVVALAYKKNKDYEPITQSEEKEILIGQVLIFNGEQDTPQNRAKYRAMTVQQLKTILDKDILPPPDGDGRDTIGLGTGW